MDSVANGTAAAPRISVIDTRLAADVMRELSHDRTLGSTTFVRAAFRANPARTSPIVWLEDPLPSPLGQFAALSLADLLTLADRLAVGYQHFNVRVGDVVAVYLKDEAAYLIHFLAITGLGAIPAFLNRRLPASSAVDFAGFVRATRLVCDREAAPALVAAGRQPTEMVDADALWAMTAEAAPKQERRPFRHDDLDPVLITHSSGTTGRPKAVVFQNGPLCFGPRARLASGGMGDERILCALPMSHNAGIAFPMMALMSGTPLFIMNNQVGEALRYPIERFRPTKVVGFAQTFSDLATRDLTGWDLRSVRFWSSTGDSAHEAHVQRLLGTTNARRRAEDAAAFIDNLGSSELAFALFQVVLRSGDVGTARCVGRPLPFVDAAVLDQDGEVLPNGRPGLLGIKSPTLSGGYWNDSNLTVRSRKRGYWLTGDVVIRREDGGYLHLDRAVDTVLAKGGPLYTLPVEERLLMYGAEIQDCAVFAVTRTGGDQVPAAVLKVSDPDTRSATQWLDTLNTHLATHELAPLAAVVLARTADDLPLGPTGKVLKRKLRERASDLFGAERPGIAIHPSLREV